STWCRSRAKSERARSQSLIYMDYNATTPLEPEVMQAVSEALQDAWGNPSSNHIADVTFVPVSRVSGRVEVEDIIAAVRPATCLISVMLANNETGVIMVGLPRISCRVKFLNKQRERLRILVHTDAAQALGKIPVDVQELGVDYLTIVGHKFYAPRIGALFVNGPGSRTPLYPMLFGGGQERNFRPGTENTPMIAGLGKVRTLRIPTTVLMLNQILFLSVFRDKIRFNNRFPGSDILPNTTNMSILGPTLQGWRVLSTCRRLLASVGAACHSASGNRPSYILLSCGVPSEVAVNALRVSVGRGTTKSEVDAVVEDLRETVQLLEDMN
uniref:Selenocysteine lyase n=1 Tax=Oryzias melastigma TaxID=30732 RepID=A0A3B3DIM9_ORYME